MKIRIPFVLLALAMALLVLWISALLGRESMALLQSLTSQEARMIACWGWIGPLLCGLPTVVRQVRRRQRLDEAV